MDSTKGTQGIRRLCAGLHCAALFCIQLPGMISDVYTVLRNVTNLYHNSDYSLLLSKDADRCYGSVNDRYHTWVAWVLHRK